MSEPATPAGPESGAPPRGRARRADWVIVTGIALRKLYGLAMLPLIPLMIGPHPLLLELLSGSTVAQVVVGARVRVGDVSWPVAILAGVVLWVASDWLYWWAGRRWGDRALTLLLARDGRPQGAGRAARLERVAGRLGPAGVVLAWFLPVPSMLVYAAVGTAGMRLTTFVLLNLIGRGLASTVIVALGYALGQRATDVVDGFQRYALVTTVVLVVLILVVAVVRHRWRPRP